MLASKVFRGRTADRSRASIVSGLILSLAIWSAASASASAALPDGRGWERVSPRDKDSLSASAWGLRAASPSGDRIVFPMSSTVPNAGSGFPSVLLGTPEDAGNWLAQPIDPASPVSNVVPFTFLGFSDDISKSVIRARAALTPGAVDNVEQLYLRDNTTGKYYAHLTPEVPAPESNGNFGFVGASADFSRIVYDSDVAQVDGLPSAATYPYVWDDGGVQLVGVLPDPDGDGPLAAPPAPNGARVGSNVFRGGVNGAVARDGSSIVFHAIEPDTDPFTSTAGQLYLRQDDGSEPARTLRVSASQRTTPDPSGPLPALFWAAEKEHGSKVLFTSCEQLTDDATAQSSGEECATGALDPGAPLTPFYSGRDLYLFDAESGDLTDLSTQDPAGANVLGVVGASDSLDQIYFVATGVLASGAPGNEPVAGKPNLYMWRDGATRFIATLDDTHVPGEFGVAAKLLDSGNWSLRNTAPGGNSKFRATRVSADGNRLLLTSRAPLSSTFDNANPTACPSWPDLIGGTGNAEGRCMEVYVYDATANELTCLSCNSTGVPPAGDADLFGIQTVAPLGPDPLPRNLSADGKRVYFEARDSLVPADRNNAVDVYEWQDGKVALISSGGSPTPSTFIDASSSGDDVFFLARDRLVPSDRDENADLYDARVGGGEQAVVPPPVCLGDECQGTLPVPPVLPSPGSNSYRGPGNAPLAKVKKAKKCKRGYVRKRVKGKVRCVKKHQSAHRRKHKRR